MSQDETLPDPDEPTLRGDETLPLDVTSDDDATVTELPVRRRPQPASDDDATITDSPRPAPMPPASEPEPTLEDPSAPDPEGGVATVMVDGAVRRQRVPEPTIPEKSESDDDGPPVSTIIGRGGGVGTGQQGLQSDSVLAGVEPNKLGAAVLATGEERRYKLGAPVAQGGMGMILKARDVNIRRGVAMKVILDPEKANQEQVLRFIEEAQITGQLQHPSVVPVHELGVDADGQVFYTMKFVEGITLKDILAGIEEGNREIIERYPLPHLLTIFQKVCDAVAFAHSRQVIHRDLKPENVMVGDYGEVLVMDWGLAKVLPKGKVRKESDSAREKKREALKERLAAHDRTEAGGTDIESVREDSEGALRTMAGGVMGTPRFMAPEQAMAEQLDERADVYSLGAILYNILTLRQAVAGRNVTEIFVNVCDGNIPHPTVYNPKSRTRQTETEHDDADLPEFARKTQMIPVKKAPTLAHCPGGAVPDSLAAVAMKALTLDRDERYPNVKALQAEIEAYQSGFATVAEEADLWKHIKLFIARHKQVSISVAVAAGILSVVVATSTWINLQEQARRRADQRKAAPFQVESAMAAAERAAAEPGGGAAIVLVREAIEWDRTLPSAKLVYAILLAHQEKYVEAAEQARAYVALAPDDKTGQDLLAACEKAAKPGATPHTGKLAMIASRTGMNNIAAGFVKDIELQLMFYRNRIEKAWPELGEKLTLTEDKEFALNVRRKDEVTDLQPVSGIPLASLNINECPVNSIAALKGMPLTRLSIVGTEVSDLSSLRGMKLVSLVLSDAGLGCPVKDLSPLAGMALTELCLEGTEVADLSPLAGMQLTSLDISGTRVCDLSPLKGMPLVELRLSTGLGEGCPVADLSPLRGMKLGALDLRGTKVTDISPLQGMPLQRLDLSTTKVASLDALRGMPLKTLYLRSCQGVSDLSPLRGVTITKLDITRLEGVSDLSPLRGMKLTWLGMAYCKGISDLSPIKDMPLAQLDLTGCDGVTDLSPLGNMPLTSLVFDSPARITKGMEVLRGMKSLKRIRVKGATVEESEVANFWKKYDAGGFRE